MVREDAVIILNINGHNEINDRFQHEHLETVDLENPFNILRVNILSFNNYLQILEFQKLDCLL